ncbi:MAG: ABC transporter substrate binding protein [Pseudomonadota bacterium]
MNTDFFKIVGLTVCVCVMALTAPTDGQTKPIQNVLVLHSYHQGLKWTDTITQGIESGFSDISDQIDLHYEYLDSKRYFGKDYFERLVEFEYYKSQLNKMEYALIICSDNNALQYIVEYGEKMYPNVPVVFCGINNFTRKMLKNRHNVTGVAETIDYESTLNLIRKIHTDRKNILVVLDKTPTGDAIKIEFDKVADKFKETFSFEYFQDFLLEEVPDKISNLGNEDVIYILTFNRDRLGNFISYTDGIRMIRKASNVPIYGSWDFYFGDGIVGGMITSGVIQGQEAAQMAKRILSGESAASIPILTKSPNKYMFDYNQMKVFGIQKEQLPPDSLFINLPLDFFDRYKRQILIFLSLVLLVVIVLVWRLIVQHNRQASLKKLNQELDRRVEQQTFKLQQKNELLTIEIAERVKLEKEIRKLASIDPLTGINNRRSFMEKATNEFIRSQRYKSALSVLMLDIDYFKTINDTHGHHIGDVCLKSFTNVCLSALRNNDFIGRMGGEEFAVILVETDKAEAIHVAERLRSQVAQTVITEDSISLQVQVSVGVSQLSEDDDSVEDTILKADKALYMAKKQGRNRVVFI